ncbi:recombinase family protein [Ruegeria arenilitoris]|uniref:recombinase family protein n=1 Tax=Ruegeria arenilitoris TaxID=1173585 RepID=UPI00147FD0CF|nr:recombinase family protein [Ruegeria arenilitoris]
MTKPMIRCAIYTRKSSDEGLDQGFNSLDAQHEACAAYIASQRHEGWKMLSTRYDDGGLSGGTLERPALQRLLADIDSGRIDMVVVYKIDRLTRSLADFAKLVDRLEAASCSFVSVTQAFNTSSSMGRLTLNVLLSFAQFEREVTAERIRDKIAASKKKGLWMGGLTPLGYDPHPDSNRRELVVNATEAETVRRLFAFYLEHGCLNATVEAVRKAGLRSKHRVFASGRQQGGAVFSRGQIYRILTNPVYRGLIRHKDKVWPGSHTAIISDDLWDRVQDKLQSASARRRGVGKLTGSITSVGHSAPLIGKFRDETGDPLTPTHTNRHGRRLRYYVSNRLVTGTTDASGWRLPAPAFEQAVAAAIADHLEELASRHAILRDIGADKSLGAARKVQDLAASIRKSGVAIISAAIASGEVCAGSIRIRFDESAIARLLELSAEDIDTALLDLESRFTYRRRGVEMKIVAGERRPTPDPVLIRALRNAHNWAAMLKDGVALRTIASREGFSESYVARIIPLATLSPRIQKAIVTGTQPLELTLETLVRTRLPLDWASQENRFAITA